MKTIPAYIRNNCTANMTNMKTNEPKHIIGRGDSPCSCGSDTCLCQKCGEVVCGTQSTWIPGNYPAHGNVCLQCMKLVKEIKQ